MQEQGTKTTTTEAVAVFHDAYALQKAADELLMHGFDHAELSVLGTERSIAAKLGHAYTSTTELEDDPDVPRVGYNADESLGDAQGALIGAAAYMPAVLGTLAVAASGGTLAGAIAVAAIAGGAGATIGAILSVLIGREHAKHLDEHLRRGGLLLWVTTHDSGREQAALDILRQNRGEHVHLHELPLPNQRMKQIPTRRPFLSTGPAA